MADENQKRAGQNLFNLYATVASIMIYVECLVIAGMSFDRAKKKALGQTVWIGLDHDMRKKVEAAVWAAEPRQMSRAARKSMLETSYLLTISELGLFDNVFRRCAFMWFGVII